MPKNVPSVGLRWGVVIFPSLNLCETIRDCPFLKSQGCWQWSPPGSSGVVEKWYWQALPRMHVQRLGVHLNTAAAARQSWSCLCLAIRILNFFFLVMPLALQDPSQFCLLHNAYLCFIKGLEFRKCFAQLQGLSWSAPMFSETHPEVSPKFVP